MKIKRSKKVKLAAIGVPVLLISAAMVTPAIAATKSHQFPTPNSQARAAGVNKKYGADMGWRNTKQKQLKSYSSTNSVTNALASTSLQQSGIDVSSHSGVTNWVNLKSVGVKFAFAKVTEGTYYKSPLAKNQIAGAKSAGIFTGAYHFANPSDSSGSAQADFFVANGGKWTVGNLPGVVDLEYNPYSGNSCYNMAPANLSAWVKDFQDRYKKDTGTFPIIYTSSNWWNQCIGSTVGSSTVSAKSPLWIANYSNTAGELPANWNHYDFWQNGAVNSGDSYSGPYDTNVFNGTYPLLWAWTQVAK